MFYNNLRFPYAMLKGYEKEIKSLFEFSEKLKSDVDFAASKVFR